MRVSRSVTIPDSEIDLSFSRSGGPGGQHANKTSTRAELVWNVLDSEALGPRQRARLQHNLRNRIDSSGNLRITFDTHRSQLRNKEEVLRRLEDLVREGLKGPRARIPSKPSRAAKAKRLDRKRRHGEIKKARQRPRLDD